MNRTTPSKRGLAANADTALQKLRTRMRGDDGFTLLETLFVAVLVGLLVVIVAPNFLGDRESARDTSVRSDLRQAANVAENLSLTMLGQGGMTYETFNTEMMYSEGFNKSDNDTTLMIMGNPLRGYCIIAGNPTAKATGLEGTWYWWDSSVGGLASSDPLPGPPNTGLCNEDFYFEVGGWVVF